MAEKSFGVKDLNIVGASGDPTIESNGDLNLKAGQVAIQTNTTVTGVLLHLDLWVMDRDLQGLLVLVLVL